MTRTMVFIVFGATGDLMHRKLFPSLYRLFKNKLLDQPLHIIGIGRRALDTSSFIDRMRDSVAGPRFDKRSWEKLALNISYQRGFFEDISLYRRLKTELELRRTDSDLFFYLATPPEHYETIINNLAKSKLVNGRILIEKPFGKDLQTARHLDMLLAKHFDEKQIYRIDHYLGKETVQNILAFRFANGIFEPTWNKDFIDHVQITISETDGVGSRGAFYEGVGALRDVVQNHMLQMVALTAMDQPRAFDAQSIRDERAKILKKIRPIDPTRVGAQTVRAQYQGYTQEPGVSAVSDTETFTAIKLELDSSRWRGVPFYLRTGKRCKSKVTEISLHYKKPIVCFGDARLPAPGSAATGGQVCLFNEADVLRNVLSIRIQPDDGIRLRLMIKKPGFGMKLTSTQMHFQYKEAFPDFSQPEAYEKLLLDAMSGDQILFARTDGIEASWNIITSILDGWKRKRVPIHLYKGGTMGPQASEDLLAADGRRWFLG